MRHVLLLILCIAIAPLSARAQVVAPTSHEDSTLAGIHTVGLVVFDPGNGLGAELSEQIFSATQLELRKSGLRVVRYTPSTPQAGAPAVLDALVCIYVFPGGPSAGDGTYVRYAVRQPVRVLRTQALLWVSTWTHEDRQQFGSVRRDAAKMVSSATDAFLGKWLDMNGR